MTDDDDFNGPLNEQSQRDHADRYEAERRLADASDPAIPFMPTEVPLRDRDTMTDRRVPDGAVRVDAWTYKGQLIVMGTPADTDGDVDHPHAHNCDAMGCGSCSHIIIREKLNEWGTLILRDENERLRGALKEISGITLNLPGTTPLSADFIDGYSSGLYAATRLATAALAATGTPGETGEAGQ